jgi:putative FmdB family regulatory protein
MDVPTYQYACTACGHQLEAVQSFADEPLTECPACEGRLRKLFSAVGVVFKGSGFYRTDSRNGSSSGAKNGSSRDGSSKDGGAKESTAAKDSGSSAGKDSGSSSSAAKDGSSSTAKAATPAAS